MIYGVIMVLQIICLGASIAALSVAYLQREYRMNYRILPSLLACMIIEIGYTMYLQATTLEGLKMSQQIFMVGKVLFPPFVFLAYGKMQKLQQAWKSTVLIMCVAAGLFVTSTRLKDMLFGKPQIMQNQYFYYIDQTLRWPLYAFLLVAAAELVIASYWALKTQHSILLALAALLPLMGETITIFLPAYARHYDFSAVMVAVSAILLTVGAKHVED
ncbi:MAG: hypothetical protein IIU45_01440 [Lachnospiraceae bacterium]|nr:hypothetical protein [Lachnospiraceae bacterium]MBQ5375512.1 hypothetical protein [Lachnospiraceae bacterium]MBR1849015.1 hypothetical protein [Lachnospiraceae bacterium]